MKRIEFIANLVHFSFYRTHLTLHRITIKFNPFRLILMIPSVKRHYENVGIDVMSIAAKATSDKRYGRSVIVAGAYIFVWFFLIYLTVIAFAYLAIGIYLKIGITHLIACSAFSIFTCYILIFRKDKYIMYFRELDKLPQRHQRIYMILSLASFVCLFFIVFIPLSIQKTPML